MLEKLFSREFLGRLNLNICELELEIATWTDGIYLTLLFYVLIFSYKLGFFSPKTVCVIHKAA